MSLWVIAYCTKPLGDQLHSLVSHALDASDFAMMAEWQGLDEEIGYAAEESLRFDRIADQTAIVDVHYSHHESGERSMACVQHTDPEFVRESVEGMLEEEPPVRVGEILPRVVETVALELSSTDWNGMGLPIAFYLAMALASPEHGDGVVEVDGEWWDPAKYVEIE